MKRIESVQNKQVREWKKLTKRKYRDNTKTFLVEGWHLVEEALRSNFVLELIIREDVELPNKWDVSNITITYVTDAIIKELSEMETPQGLFAVCRQFEYREPFPEGSFLFIDSVQDPGNLGAIIRTADAAGITAIIIGEGSVDIYNSKAIRATQGSLFHLPIVKGVIDEWIRRCKDRQIPVYGTSLHNSESYLHIPRQQQFALIVGNEGAGISETILAQTDKNLYIPIYGKAESLNVAVATGILLYHLKA